MMINLNHEMEIAFYSFSVQHIYVSNIYVSMYWALCVFVWAKLTNDDVN